LEFLEKFETQFVGQGKDLLVLSNIRMNGWTADWR
jgi:hypothetical protein